MKKDMGGSQRSWWTRQWIRRYLNDFEEKNCMEGQEGVKGYLLMTQNKKNLLKFRTEKKKSGEKLKHSRKKHFSAEQCTAIIMLTLPKGHTFRRRSKQGDVGVITIIQDDSSHNTRKEILLFTSSSHLCRSWFLWNKTGKNTLRRRNIFKKELGRLFYEL